MNDVNQPSVFVLAFDSTHAAMAADKAFAGMGAALIPTPRAITAGCGMSLKFSAESNTAAVLRAQSVEAAHNLTTLYRAEGQSYTLIVRL